jgi:hypothetical protein
MYRIYFLNYYKLQPRLSIEKSDTNCESKECGPWNDRHIIGVRFSLVLYYFLILVQKNSLKTMIFIPFSLFFLHGAQ